MQHIAMIMDGNRRWAREKRLQAVTMGHKKGVEAVKTAVKFCLKNGIKYLSLYTFSLENFKRDLEEKTYIFNLLVNVLQKNSRSLLTPDVIIQKAFDGWLFDAGCSEAAFGSASSP